MKTLTENQCLCPKCGSVKTYSEKVRERNKTSLCRSCAKTKREEDKKRYKRICDVCGDVKEVRYRPSSNRCADCSRKELGANLKNAWHKRETGYGYGKLGLTTYAYFCPKCPHIRISGVRRKTSLCGKCARTDAYRFRWSDHFFNFNTMSMETIILREEAVQPNIKLSSALDRIMQPKAKIKATAKPVGKKRVAKRKSKSMSKEKIERIREMNRKHRDLEAKSKKEQKTGLRTYDEDIEWQRKQIDEFLKNRGVTIVEDNKVSGDFFKNDFTN